MWLYGAMWNMLSRASLYIILTLPSWVAASPGHTGQPIDRHTTGDAAAYRPTSSQRHVRLLDLGLDTAIRVDSSRLVSHRSPSFGDKAVAAVPGSHGFNVPVDDSAELPVLGADGRRIRVTTRLEDFARQVHREGLPLARVWENHAMLLSVGLNPKGKPGLWIVQKIP